MSRNSSAARASIGTAGWNYTHWKNGFFEGVPQKKWLAYCAERFSGLEANGTFYRLQSENTFKQWIERTPNDFVFTAKGHRFVTHNKKLLDADETVVTSRDNMRPLQKKLAVVVWQLPEKFSLNLERVDAFARVLARRWKSVRHAIEFRHPSWFADEVAEILTSREIAVCQSDCATWPLWDAVTTDLVYVRLHGHEQCYRSRYSDRQLDDWARKTRIWMREGRDVHIYFDNDAEGHAPYDALRLLERLGASAHTT